MTAAVIWLVLWFLAGDSLATIALIASMFMFGAAEQVHRAYLVPAVALIVAAPVLFIVSIVNTILQAIAVWHLATH